MPKEPRTTPRIVCVAIPIYRQGAKVLLITSRKRAERWVCECLSRQLGFCSVSPRFADCCLLPHLLPPFGTSLQCPKEAGKLRMSRWKLPPLGRHLRKVIHPFLRCVLFALRLALHLRCRSFNALVLTAAPDSRSPRHHFSIRRDDTIAECDVPLLRNGGYNPGG